MQTKDSVHIVIPRKLRDTLKSLARKRSYELDRVVSMAEVIEENLSEEKRKTK